MITDVEVPWTFSFVQARASSSPILKSFTHLSNHHVAIKRPLAAFLRGSRNVWSYLGDDRRAEGDVGNKVAVHHVDVDPLRIVPHEVGAGFAQGGEVGAED
jgi:hypothetical protein